MNETWWIHSNSRSLERIGSKVWVWLGPAPGCVFLYTRGPKAFSIQGPKKHSKLHSNLIPKQVQQRWVESVILQNKIPDSDYYYTGWYLDSQEPSPFQGPISKATIEKWVASTLEENHGAKRTTENSMLEFCLT